MRDLTQHLTTRADDSHDLGVLAVSRLSAEIWSPLSPTTAPAAALTIIDQMPTSLRVVASPFGIGKQGRYAAKGRYRLLTLSFRSALRKARIERPIASGVGTDFALQLSWWSGPGPALRCSAPDTRCQALFSQTQVNSSALSRFARSCATRTVKSSRAKSGETAAAWSWPISTAASPPWFSSRGSSGASWR